MSRPVRARVLVTSVVLTVLLLGAIAPAATAATPQSAGPASPLSASLLTARALRSGTLSLPGGGGTASLPPAAATTVLPNVQASEGGQPVNETPIVANPSNAQQLLTGGNDYNCANLQGFYTSSNGGSTWTHTCMQNLAGQSGCGDPGVGYDLNGVAYISGIESPDGCTTASIIIEKSTNNGGSWSAPATAVTALFPSGLTDKPWLQVDTGPTSPNKNALYISVTQFDPSSNSAISVSHSTDGGATWKTVAVDTKQIFPMVDQFSDLAIGSDGTVYVSWMRCVANGTAGDCGGTKSTMVMATSTDGGNTWSAPAAIANVRLAPDACGCAFYGSLPNTSERVSDIPVIDVDGSGGSHNGTLYAVMYTWTGRALKVGVTASADGGATWSGAVPVSPPTGVHDQFFPWLSVSGTGVVGVTWLDRRNDPQNVNYEAFGTTSTDGGSSFTTNVQIATAASNPFNDGFGGSFMGDYTGNSWAGGTLYAAWTDTRPGDGQDATGGFTP